MGKLRMAGLMWEIWPFVRIMQNLQAPTAGRVHSQIGATGLQSSDNFVAGA